MPSITEMLYALSLEARVVGVTSNCNYPPEAKNKNIIGGFFLNLETIVSLKPDLVVMSGDLQNKDVERFKKFGLPVLTINPKTIDGVMESLIALGEKTGTQERAKDVVGEMQEKLHSIEAQTKEYRPSIVDVLKLWNPAEKQRKALVIVGLNPLVVAGGETFIDDILKRAAIENVAAPAKAVYPQYSFEKLVAENPQYIIIPDGLIKQEEIKKSNRWRSLEAVRKNRILFINEDLLSRPGPRVVEAVAKIANFVYK